MGPTLLLAPTHPNPTPATQLKWYTVDVQYRGEVVGTGSGWEKRWAEQAAARQALENMGALPGADGGSAQAPAG